MLFNSKAIDPSFRFKIGYAVQVSLMCGVSHSATQNLILIYFTSFVSKRSNKVLSFHL